MDPLSWSVGVWAWFVIWLTFCLSSGGTCVIIGLCLMGMGSGIMGVRIMRKVTG